MGGFSIWHWLIVGAVVMLIFGGKGKISDIMGDVAKGIKSFKKGLAEDDEKPEASRPAQNPAEAPVRGIDHQPAADAAKVSDTRRVG
jgi:sec-independent protein translocase protein TatA